MIIIAHLALLTRKCKLEPQRLDLGRGHRADYQRRLGLSIRVRPAFNARDELPLISTSSDLKAAMYRQEEAAAILTGRE